MLDFEGVTSDEFVEYKGRPLVRKGNIIFYGDLSEKYYVSIMIMSEKKSPKGDINVPDTIMVQLIESATKKPEQQKPAEDKGEKVEKAEAKVEKKEEAPKKAAEEAKKPEV